MEFILFLGWCQCRLVATPEQYEILALSQHLFCEILAFFPTSNFGPEQEADGNGDKPLPEIGVCFRRAIARR